MELAGQCDIDARSAGTARELGSSSQSDGQTERLTEPGGAKESECREVAISNFLLQPSYFVRDSPSIAF